jgi:hypothetical protein
MTTLAADKNRNFELNEDLVTNDLPVIAADIIYAGAAVGDNGSGLAQPLADGDPFMGFAMRRADNSLGAASAIDVLVAQKGNVELIVTGVNGAEDEGATVYATDDDTFSLTDSGSDTAIGKVRRVINTSTGLCIVHFESASMRSI